MEFIFIVISNAGVPIFEYPMNMEEISDVNINTVLFSGLMSAINSYALETTGQIIGDLKFGSVQATFSKDGFNNLYVVLGSDDIQNNTLKQIHIEIKALFMNSLEQLGIKLDPDAIEKIEKYGSNDKLITSIFDPFHRMWYKKLTNNKH